MKDAWTGRVRWAHPRGAQPGAEMAHGLITPKAPLSLQAPLSPLGYVQRLLRPMVLLLAALVVVLPTAFALPLPAAAEVASVASPAVVPVAALPAGSQPGTGMMGSTGPVSTSRLSADTLETPGAASPPSRPGASSAADHARVFSQALEASRAGRFGEALPLWERVLELAPADAAAWSNHGNVQLALGDAAAAIADQERAMRLEPDNPDPHLNRGTAEEALGRWDEAAADYAWILERDPLDAAALYNLGNVEGSRGDWQAARRCFEAAATARPGFAMARSSAALAAFQLGDLEQAERELRSLIRRYPLFADARAGLTALLWQRSASGEAESHWVAASGLDARYRQSDWLLTIRRWPPEAVAALERFRQLKR